MERKSLIKATNRVQTWRYLIFYIALSLFLIMCMAELFITVQVKRKFKYKMIHPELEIRPIINETSKTVLIWYDENDVSSVDKWIKLTDNFLEDYRMKAEPLNAAPSCDFKHPPKKGKTCPVEMNDFGPCISPFYGYYSFSPCIFLRLNKVYGWIPEYYNSLENLPPSMPEDLVKTIKIASARGEGNQVWVSCEGEYDLDKESIEVINYYPSRGFPSYFFPIKDKNENFNPLIAVEIVNPKPGFIVSIKCRAWTRNLEYSNATPDEQKASVHFGIFRDELEYQEEPQ